MISEEEIAEARAERERLSEVATMVGLVFDESDYQLLHACSLIAGLRAKAAQSSTAGVGPQTALAQQLVAKMSSKAAAAKQDMGDVVADALFPISAKGDAPVDAKPANNNLDLGDSVADALFGPEKKGA